MPTFIITDTKLYVPVVTLSTQDNVKLLKELVSGFKRIINQNKHPSKTTNQLQNQYLDYLIDPSFQGENRFFALSFGNEDDRESYNRYYLPTVEIKYYNVMFEERNFFDQPVKNDLRTYDNSRKNATGQRDDYTPGCLLNYNCFEKYYKLMSIDVSKQQALDADPKAVQ